MRAILITLLLLVVNCQNLWENTPLIIDVGQCYGNCPAYRLEVRPNGDYILENQKNPIQVTGSLNRSEMRKLKMLLKATNLQKTGYHFGRQSVTDLATIKVHFIDNTTIIYGRRFAPKSYKKLIAWSDSLHQHTPSFSK